MFQLKYFAAKRNLKKMFKFYRNSATLFSIGATK